MEKQALQMSVDIVAAYASANKMEPGSIPGLLQSVHDTVVALSNGRAANAGNREPAIDPKQSVKPGYIVCLEDGKRLKMLKRYLRTQYGLSPEDYRRKWGLPADYPMVSPEYSKRRSAFAKEIGLGTRPVTHRQKRRRKAKGVR